MATQVDLVNLTTHNVVIINPATNKEILSIPTTNSVARVCLNRKQINVLQFHNVSIPIFISNWGKVNDLPEQKEDTFYIVSSLVADANQNRSDLLVPDQPVYQAGVGLIGTLGLRLNKRK